MFGDGFHVSSTSTVLHYRDDEVAITDGPYIEGKEHVGGINIIKVPDLDAALDWTRKLAKIIPLPIEVRPFYTEV